MNYKAETIRSLQKINDEHFLKQIYTLVLLYIQRHSDTDEMNASRTFFESSSSD